MLQSVAFQIYAVCASLLVLNLLFLANGTAATRARAGKVLNAEDKKLNQKSEVQPNDEGAVARWRRAHLNALENILPFLPMGFLLVLTEPSVALAAALFGTFTFFRLVHTVAYLKAVQPLRTASFAIAALALAGVVGTFLVQVLTV
jgi:uncharacterized MAPEG superfamily protein